VDLKERVALEATLALRSKQEARCQNGNAEIASRPPSKKKKARSKVPATNVSDDWTLTTR